jgi:competence protein ComEC
MSGAFRLPLIPILIFYTIGIYFGHFDFPFLSQGWILLLILLGFWILLLIIKRIQMGSWIAFSIFFLLGIFSIQLYLHPQYSPSHLSHFTSLERISLEGIIDRPPETSRGRTQLLIRSQKVILSNRHISVDGLLLIFLKEEDPSLRVGDRLRFFCRLHSPRGFHNPGGFSYERHLAFERIHTVGFLSEKKGWVKLGKGFKNPIILQVESWRDRIRDFLNREVNAPTSSIFKALVLGEQGDIDQNLQT